MVLNNAHLISASIGYSFSSSIVYAFYVPYFLKNTLTLKIPPPSTFGQFTIVM